MTKEKDQTKPVVQYSAEQLADNAIKLANINLLNEELRGLLANVVATEKQKKISDATHEKARAEYIACFTKQLDIKGTLLNLDV